MQSIEMAANGTSRRWAHLDLIGTLEMDDWQGSGKALVVDDDALVRRTLERSLEHCGFDVLSADGGRRALELAAEHGDQLVAVLLDLNMPDMGGQETLKEMRKLYPDLTVILVSGYDEREVARRFHDDQPTAVLKKPFRPRELKAKLRAVLEGSADHDPT